HVETLLRRSEGATLERWLSVLPAESIRARPRLCLAQAIAAIVSGRLEAVEPLVADAERAFAAAGDEPHEPSVGRALSVLANVPASIAFLRADLARLRGDAAGALDFDAQALAHLDEDDWLMRSQVAWNVATVPWVRGELGEAERALADLVAQRVAAGQGYLAMRVCDDHREVQRAQGRLAAALRSYRRSLEIATEAGQQPPPAGMAHVGLAEVLYERNELAAAHEHATQGAALCRQLAFTQPLARSLAMLARIRQAQGDTAGALEAIGQAEQVKLSPQLAAMYNPVPAWRGRPLLALGRAAAPAPRGWGPPRSRATHGNVTTWRWRGCCSPNTPPARRSGSSTGSTPRRQPSGGPAASSKRRRCGRSRSRAAATWPPLPPAWPKRWRWPLPKATYACSPTRARPWPASWAGSPLPSAPGWSCSPGRSRSATSTG